MPLQRSIELLKPEFRDKVKLLLQQLDEKGIKYYINETLRERGVQLAYYAQGRQPLIAVNTLRKQSGLWLINEKENEKCITWTMKSKHLDGLAIDICPVKDGKPWWTAPDEKWKEIAEISKSLGLNAGYYWKQHDNPHHQAFDT
jgi:peptidoglycan LD-endopeptidase CwlK